MNPDPICPKCGRSSLESLGSRGYRCLWRDCNSFTSRQELLEADTNRLLWYAATEGKAGPYYDYKRA